jgi:hypothetical protein
MASAQGIIAHYHDALIAALDAVKHLHPSLIMTRLAPVPDPR